MGFSHQYFKDQNFLLTRASGDIDGKDLMRHVIEINEETEGIVDLKELSDCREITSLDLLSTKMATMSAATESDKPGSRLAILVPKNNDVVYGIANAYKMFSEDHRAAVKVFKQLDEAISWLAESEAEEKAMMALVNDE